jgi:membrane protein YqaA with SNARE-associated domain
MSSFRFFLTWWGAFVFGVLDSSLVFFMPFGIDALVIYLAARDQHLFWMYPLLATAGSLVGAAVTFWIGQKAGEVGLERLVDERRLNRFRDRARNRGAVAMAIPALLPPPFPLTVFTLTCGALAVNRWLFFGTFGAMRLLRFGVEATLARLYGRGILRVLESDSFQIVVIAFIVVAVVGTIASAVVLWRKAHRPALYPA